MARPFNKKQTISALGIFLIYTFLTYGRGWLEQDTTQAESRKISSSPLVTPHNSISAEEQTNRKAASSEKRELILTEHAKCRMQCRQVSQIEIDEVIAKGTINHKKSNPNDAPCPTKAIEKRSKKDNQLIRVVLATCPKADKVITVIDLENEYDCDCH